MSDRVARRPVNPDTLDSMHFFVVCGNKPSIIVSRELENFSKEPTCSFTVPANQAEYWNRELEKTVEANSFMSWTLTVKQLAENKQEVKVLFNNDDIHTFSWYEVEDHKITPRYIKIIHMGYGFVAWAIGILIWLLGWWTGRKLYRKFRSA